MNRLVILGGFERDHITPVAENNKADFFAPQKFFDHQAGAESVNSGFGDALMKAATGNLKGTTLRWKPEPSVCVVLAAHGYPGQVRTGDVITGIDDCGAQVFHAGTKMGPNGLESSGGRVLGVTASGSDLAAAVRTTYQAVDKIHFDGMHYRRDIAEKGLRRWPLATIEARPGT